MSSTTSSALLVVGLNPALQKRLVLPTPLTAGQVHRVSAVQSGIGGKGQDVAIALQCLFNDNRDNRKQQPSCRLLQFLGQGQEGDAVLHQLQQKGIILPNRNRVSNSNSISTTMMHDDDDPLTVRTASPLRTCTSLVAPDATTELVEPSGAVTPDEVDALFQAVDETLLGHDDNDNTCASITGVAMMGSLPPGCPTNIYATLYKKLASSSSLPPALLLCLVDSTVGLEALLQAVHDDPSSTRGRVVLKINVAELGQLVQQQQPDDDDEVVVTAALDAFFEQYPTATALHAILLTNGPDPAFCALVNNDDNNSNNKYTLTTMPTPKLSHEQTLFPIGAGDAVAAGTLAAWHVLEYNNNNNSPSWIPPLLAAQYDNDDASSSQYRSSSTIATAFGFGLACGSASCLQEENSVLDVANVLQLWQQQQQETASV